MTATADALMGIFGYRRTAVHGDVAEYVRPIDRLQVALDRFYVHGRYVRARDAAAAYAEWLQFHEEE